MLENKREKTFTLSFFVVTIISVAVLIIASQFCKYTATTQSQEDAVTATVTQVLGTKVESPVPGYESTYVSFFAKVTSGPHKGEVIEMSQPLGDMLATVSEPVEEGDKIMVLEVDMNGETVWTYYGLNRINGLFMLVGAFVLMIFLIGRGKGFATIISLILTIGAIFFVYIPSILLGRNIYVLTILVTVYIVLSSLILLNGFNKKTFCAMVGNVGGTLIAGVLALFVNNMLGVTGLLDEDYKFLMVLSSEVKIDLKAVVWGGILIGSLGAVMDVAMSIASAMCELSEHMEKKSFTALVRSGMSIGRDAIGTMTNTLILAYVGGSLAVVLLFAAYDRNAMVVWNMEMVVVEVVQAVVGSMGILIAVPLTVFFSAGLYMKDTTKRRYAN